MQTYFTEAIAFRTEILQGMILYYHNFYIKKVLLVTP